MKTIWETARDLLTAQTPCVLALILNSSGSTPRGEGAKMLVQADGTIHGTIGGGPMEWSAIHTAQEILAQGHAQVLRFDMGGTDPMNDVSICGGMAEVCLRPLDGGDLPVLEALCTCLTRREEASFLLWQEGDAYRTVCLSGGESITGAALEQGTAEDILRAYRARAVHDDARLAYFETVCAGSRVWLIGGGHVALATAQVAGVAGFDVVVVDDREEFANPARFPGARCVVCEEYDRLPIDEVTASDYIVVVTRGHENDREALAWALRTKACYIGMIGSCPKRDLIYQKLIEQGIDPARLAQVHSPIGLPIGGRTPGDIAVSIVAEMISIRSGAVWERGSSYAAP